MRQFIAIDGEAIGTDGRYALLAASTGLYRWSDSGLSTATCLDFLLGLQTPQTELVGFGIGYDINQWLIDLDEHQLRELWTTGSVLYGNYALEWLRGRRFYVKDRRDGRFAYVQETFGFFQSSFVKAARAWGLDPGDSMDLMKLARGSFTAAQRQQIIDYCLSECRVLVALMDRLRHATSQAGCTPRPHMWIGAGQLASQLLNTHGLAAHHQHDEAITPPGAADPLMRAYYGGRAELLRQGERTSVNTYDLRSAYPWAATFLPSLTGAKIIRRRAWQPDAQHGIWHVRWHDLPGHVMPFPVRVNKAISYPRSGEGWYHHAEIAAAIKAGYQLDIREGYQLIPGPAPAPFARLIPALFEQRRRWQQEGNAAEKALKLGLNSLYGKTAQGFSADGLPRWQSYWWAGEITARTRGRMLAAASRATDPLMIATDGLFCAKAPARAGAKVGGWEHGHLDWIFTACPGVYHGTRGEDEVLKSRGFFARDIDYDQLHAGWLADGPEHVYTYTSRRFLGIGQALQRTDGMALWRRWIDAPRNINLMPQRKVIVRDHRYGGWRCDPIAHAGPSEPYVPKGALMDPDQADNNALDDQPLRDTI